MLFLLIFFYQVQSECLKAEIKVWIIVNCCYAYRTTMASNLYSSEHDVKFKVALVGDSGVGKTAVMLRFTNGLFPSNVAMTVGIDWRVKIVKVDGMKVKLQIWDTAGQERFSSLAPLYCRKADAVLMVYDITRMDSFQNIDYWLERVGMPMKAEIVLIGNKVDIEEHRIVTTDMGQCKKQELPGCVHFFETSAKTNANIDQVFNQVVSRLLSKMPSVDPHDKTVISLSGWAMPKMCCSGSGTPPIPS